MDIPSNYSNPVKVEAATYNQVAAYINYLRRYHGLSTITFSVAKDAMVKAAETNTLLSALEDIHKLLPTTNKFDKVKKGDLITKKTYNQIINGLREG